MESYLPVTHATAELFWKTLSCLVAMGEVELS